MTDHQSSQQEDPLLTTTSEGLYITTPLWDVSGVRVGAGSKLDAMKVKLSEGGGGGAELEASRWTPSKQ